MFPSTVDFSPDHVLTPSATGFPPAAAQAGAVGEPGYSPLVEVVFRGQKVVLNAPQVANASGQADREVSMTPLTVSYRETDGCYDNESVHYASFDSSNPTAAAIEDATYTPNLNAVPSAGCADAAVSPLEYRSHSGSRRVRASRPRSSSGRSPEVPTRGPRRPKQATRNRLEHHSEIDFARRPCSRGSTSQTRLLKLPSAARRLAVSRVPPAPESP